jgi:putative cardiolipin synthase
VDPLLLETFQATRREALFSTPYLMPISKELEGLRGLLDQGVAVRILTNSLASTDVLISQASYASHRPRMLAEGASIFELRPDAARRSHYAPAADAASRLSLHAKAAVFDRKVVYIGSFNFDRYGAKINTESGLMVHSPELAEAVLTLLEADLLPQNSWRVVATEDEGCGGADLKWIAESGGREVEYESDPEASLNRRIKAWLLGLFPIR